MNTGVILFSSAIVLTILLWQFRTHWLYLCRVSLLGLLFLASLPVFAVSVGRSLLIGVFDLDSTASGFAVGFLLFFVAWAITATSELVLQLADARLTVKVPEFGRGIYIVRAILILLAVTINCVVVVAATDGPKVAVAWGLLFGLVAGLAVFVVIQVVEARFNETSKLSKPFSTKALVRWIWRQILRPNVTKPSDPTTPEGFVLKFGRYAIRVCGWLGRGYLHQAKRGATVLPEHARAAAALVVFAALYASFAVLKSALPALCYLLLLLIIFIWLVSGVSFFLDSYRVPSLIPLVVLVCLSSAVKHSDHFYRIWPVETVAESTDTRPGEVLARAADDGQRIVLVAAAGGGIQAAAWTARVLTGLEEILDEKKPGAFTKSIRLLSGVSGGSTGIMFYVHATYPRENAGPVAIIEHKRIVDAAEASSLSQAVRGLAYSDFWRALPPFVVPDIYDDRAERLERAWIENDEQQFHRAKGASIGDATLSKWRHDLAEGKRPAIIFNSTAVETGERFTFSTCRFRDEDLAQGQRDFARSCEDTDISIPTAVRLSATFPIVSPAAQPALAKNSTSRKRSEADRKITHLHLVDGGYFDNSGLVALSNWLDSALQDLVQSHPSKVPKNILVIQILPFPEPALGAVNAPRPHFSRLLSPLQTVLSVREQVQTGLAQRDFASVSTRWKLEAFNPESPAKVPPIDIQLVNVVYQDDGLRRYTPLSWHLRQSEQDAIEESWNRFKRNSNLGVIKRFFFEN